MDKAKVDRDKLWQQRQHDKVISSMGQWRQWLLNGARQREDTTWAGVEPRAPISDAQRSGPVQMRLDGRLCNADNAEPRRERDGE